MTGVPSKWTKDGLFSSKSNQWETPQWLFDHMNELYKFEVDVCASEQNAKCPIFFTEEDDALGDPWNKMLADRGHERASSFWCNPPYGRDIHKWARCCAMESELMDRTSLVAMLVYARTDTSWFHDYVMGYAREIYFIKRRLKFIRDDGKTGPATAPSMVVVFDSKWDLPHTPLVCTIDQ